MNPLTQPVIWLNGLMHLVIFVLGTFIRVHRVALQDVNMWPSHVAIAALGEVLDRRPVPAVSLARTKKNRANLFPRLLCLWTTNPFELSVWHLF